jgi:pyridoxine 5-phosphate synthase
MTRLSVNINKIALLRNARGANIPDLLKFAEAAERYGVDGITVHPRPDERHIRRSDVYELKPLVKTEFNIEGYPSRDFLDMVLEVKPHQCTLVPDPPDALTSSEGWDTIKHADFLKDVVSELQGVGIRTSLFLEPRADMLEGAAKSGTNRIEYYTGPYAEQFYSDREGAVAKYRENARLAKDFKLGINAGHDLNLDNLKFFCEEVEGVLEVSIGQALVRDCLYFGLQNVIPMYKRLLS